MNAKRVLQACAAAAMIAVTIGCASLVTGGPLVRPNEPTGAIQLQNRSASTVTVVLISACEVGSYGMNRLPQGATVPPGRSYQWTVSAGCWDISAGYGNATSYSEARDRFQVLPGRISVFGVTGR